MKENRIEEREESNISHLSRYWYDMDKVKEMKLTTVPRREI
jgi:hypothetical protein